MTQATADKPKIHTVEKSIDVNVPVTTAYNQWTQFESFPQFMSGVDKIEQVDNTHLRWDVSIGGVKRQFDAVITEQVPDERIAWQSIDGESHTGVVTFSKAEDASTRVTVRMGWKPQDFVEKIGAALQVDDMQIGRDLKKFKELIESQGFEEGAWRGTVKDGTERPEYTSYA